MNNNVKMSESEFFIMYRDFLTLKNSAEKDAYLKNDDFVIAAANYLDKSELNAFFHIYHKQFNQELLERVDVMKPFALKVFNSIFESNLKFNIEAMREIAAQPGIHPMLVCYVDPKVQNDYVFISNIIANTDVIYDFYGNSMASFEGSNMRYGDAIGKDVQTNPMFWTILNARLRREYPDQEMAFDVEKEVEIATKYFAKQEEYDNVERTSMVRDDKPICVTLTRDSYLKDNNPTYIVRFDYSSPEQVKYMIDTFNNSLIPAIGVGSHRFKEGSDIIRPYLVDDFGVITTSMSKARAVGGTNVPEELLYEFIRRLVEYDGCRLICGDLEMEEHFSPEIFDSMIQALKSNQK